MSIWGRWLFATHLYFWNFRGNFSPLSRVKKLVEIVVRIFAVMKNKLVAHCVHQSVRVETNTVSKKVDRVF